MNTTPLHNILTFCTTLLLSVLFSACDVHQWPDDDKEEPPSIVDSHLKLVYRDIDMPIYTVVDFVTDAQRSRATDSDIDIDSRHIIKVYADNSTDANNRAPLTTEVATIVLTDAADAATADRPVDIPLPPGRYTYVAWTDYGRTGEDDDLYYRTADFAEITLRSTERDGFNFHTGNTPYRDAFRGEGTFRVGTDGRMYDADDLPIAEGIIDMRRPLARFMFVSTDLSEFISSDAMAADTATNPEAAPRPSLSDFRIVFRYTGYMPYVFNANTDRPIDSQTGAAFEGDITRSPQDEGEAALGSDFVFIGNRESSVLVAVDVYNRATGELVSSAGPISVPIVRNKLTIVRGRFLTSKIGSVIGVDPDFFGDINIEIR